MIFDSPQLPGWRHPLTRATTRVGGNQRRGYDPNQPRVPAGDPDGGQWTRIGRGAAQRNELTPEQVARLEWAYLRYGGNVGVPDAFADTGQRIDAETAGLHYVRARMYAPLSSDRPAERGDDASVHFLPLTDVDPETGWIPEPDYVASRRGGPRFSPAEQLRIDLYNQALRNVRRFDPGFREVSNPNSAPSVAAIARLEALAQGLARTHSYFETRGISLTPHALRSIAARPNRGVSPETALHAYNSGRLFHDPSSRYFIRRDSQTGVFVVVTSPRGGQIRSAAEGRIGPRWIPVPYR
jgi:hypothetical protein